MDRKHFFSALAGLLVGAMLIAVMPAAAGDGDPMHLGQKNHARRVTKLIGKNGMEIRASKNIPMRLYSQPGVPPLQVNQQAWVENLNADMVDGRDAASLMRGEFCAEDDATDFTDYSCTMNITAPAAGYIFMAGSVDLWRTESGDLMHCKFTLDTADVVGSLMEMDHNLAQGNGEENCHSTAGVAVAAGPHTVTFEMKSVNTTTKLGDVGAYAFYVPFDGSGSIP
jgi:hypothetical protein